jgi:hypothetical protein
MGLYGREQLMSAKNCNSNNTGDTAANYQINILVSDLEIKQAPGKIIDKK